MKVSGQPNLPRDAAIPYEIRIRGGLDETWLELVDEATLEVARDQDQLVTIIHVVIQDQAALAGLLDALFTFNATVLSVTALEQK